MKDFFKGRGIGYWLTVPALILGVAAVILYQQNGITEFSPKLSSAAIVPLWIGAGICLVSLVIELKPVKLLAYLAYLYAIFGFLGSQATYIANLIADIDGNTMSTGFIMTTAAMVLAILVALFAAILTKEKEAEKNA